MNTFDGHPPWLTVHFSGFDMLTPKRDSFVSMIELVVCLHKGTHVGERGRGDH
jgi:hypothetical protein